ncbi:hypothetical protein RR46_00358 [Papilio xuthus]|uniref:Uncharacterized protein n=1 Tax=Papilio xuthus TaxID=66420 RepID=A0A0N1IBV9_PAPXU|nr:hypothetical protein RR46_00358 [Papilio xuthus]
MISSCEAFSEHPSPGEENYQSYNSRCGSSFARDSGGSSGHYTQRSAPPHARPPRADSGSSTQHEHASRYGARAREPAECYVSAPPQFRITKKFICTKVFVWNASRTASIDTINCPPQASAPPPQFQDEPPVYDYGDYECTYKAPLKCLNVGRHEYTARDYNRYHEPSTELVSKQPQYQDPRRVRHEDTQDYVNAPQQKCGGEEVTSPLGTFKRQRCLRYKQRRPRPILRSKSDISDRYRRTDGRSASSAPCEGEREVRGVAGGGAEEGGDSDSRSEGSARLRHFFERLGLEARQYDALLRGAPPDSPVFFSSASTVDSNQLANAADYTVRVEHLTTFFDIF